MWRTIRNDVVANTMLKVALTHGVPIDIGQNTSARLPHKAIAAANPTTAAIEPSTVART